MPLWSLTQERVEKLRRQIGDKEVEIDVLIKLSKEDLWKKDLDDFIEEWRLQLDDERQRKRRVNNMGRRASAKLKLGARAPAVKKRKAMGDDPEDSDFGGPKPKKSVNEAKRPTITVPHKQKAGILGYLNKASPTSKTNGGAKFRQVDGAEDDSEMDVDDDEVVAPVAEKAKSKPISRGKIAEPAPKKTKALPKSKPVEEDDDSDIHEATRPVPTRQARTARKPINYGLSDSDSDNGDDLLGDVGKMVKGIGGVNGESTADGRPLFTSSLSRPGSSAGLKPAPRLSKPFADLSADDTDYSKLVPQQSPRRSILVTSGKDTALSDEDEEDDDDDIFLSAPKVKPKAKAAPRPAQAETKPVKPVVKAGRGRAKKDTETKVSASSKKIQLSPAAKAYAAKQAKANKRRADKSDDDADAMADDILSSEGSIKENSPPPQKAPARPARRAATTKAVPRYVIDDDSDEDGGADQMDSSAMFTEDDE